MDYTKQGLIRKYILQKADGTPLESGSKYFVLRYDRKDGDPHREACRAALRTYAEHIRPHLPLLADDLERQLAREGFSTADSLARVDQKGAQG